MWPVFSLLVAAAAVAAVELPGIVRSRSKKDTAAFLVLLVAATALSIAYVLEVPIPNPVVWITRVFMPVSKWIEQLG